MAVIETKVIRATWHLPSPGGTRSIEGFGPRTGADIMALRAKRVDSGCYSLGGNYYAEKMENNTWTAYEAIGVERYIWRWSSPRHKTLRAAKTAIAARVRRTA